MPVSFHLDEHIPIALAAALRQRGIDVTTTMDAGLVAALDRQHLEFALRTGRVFVTQDADFLRLHAEGVSHAGIAYCHPQSRAMREMLRRLLLIHAAMSSEEMRGRVEYL